MAFLTSSEFNLLRFLTRVTERDHPLAFTEVSPYLLPYSTIEFNGETASKEEKSKTIQFNPQFIDRLNQILSQYVFKTILRWDGWKARPYTQGDKKVHCRVFELSAIPQTFGRFAIEFWTWMIEETCQIIEQEESVERTPPVPKSPEDRILNLFFVSDILLGTVNINWDIQTYKRLARYIPAQCMESNLCESILGLRYNRFIPAKGEISLMERSILESLSGLIPASVKFLLQNRTHHSEFRQNTLPSLKIKIALLYELVSEEGGFIFLEHFIGVGQSLLEEELFQDGLETPKGPIKGEDESQFLLEKQEFIGSYLGRATKLRAQLQAYTFIDDGYEHSRWGLEIMTQKWDPIEIRLKEILEKMESACASTANG